MVAYHNMPRCTLEEKLWLSLIKLRPCCVCAYPPVCEQTSPTQVHHLLIGGRRIGHFHAAGHCPARSHGRQLRDQLPRQARAHPAAMVTQMADLYSLCS
jgi:hypothetical protein